MCRVYWSLVLEVWWTNLFFFVCHGDSWGSLLDRRSYNNLIVWTEKAMAPHSSTLAWKIPWTEEPGRLQSMGSLRVRHDWVTSLSLFTFMHWRRKWQPIPVFLPGECQGRGSLLGSCLWGRTESDTTEVTLQQQLCEREKWDTNLVTLPSLHNKWP